MKKYLSKIILSAFVLFGLLIYLFTSYNPTAYSWQTTAVTYLTKLTDFVFLPLSLKKHSLPTYQVTINPDNYIVLNQNLPDPRQTQGILPDTAKQYVPAKFKFQDQEYDVQVRIRGLDFDHWVHPKKSWRIKFKANQPFFGQTSINLIIPEDRGMYLEELSNFRAKKLGLVVPKSQYAVLKVNGQTQGVYWQVNHFTPAFLEKNQLPVGNLYGDIDQMVSLDQQQSIYQSTYYFKKYVQDEIYKTDNYAEISLLLGLLNNASDQEFFASLPLILDMDNFLSWQAHSVLMSSIHQDSIHNIRLYWHPALGKFFIFPWDVLGGQVVWPVDYHPLVSRVLENPDWLQKRNKILSEYVNNPDNLTEDLEYYDEQVKKTKIAIFKDYKKFFSNLGYLKQTQKTRQQIINQFELIKKSIAENSIPNESSAFKFPLTEKIDVNHIDKPVDQSEFQYLDQSIKLPAKLNYSAGNHYINQTIIIPKGYKLTLQSGARLIFAPNTSLLSYSPVEANNVTITAQDSKKPWGVFALLGSDASQSTFNNILVEHGSEAIINGTYFSGALAIHQAANTKITNSTFRYNHGDDGLNIKYADANVVNNLFIQNDFDGFDLDFGSGQVLNNQFIKNGNDGLDLGSASPLIKDNLIDTAGDKCISLGETSSPKINQNILKNCNFGIAVKDSSQPIITDNQITNNHIGLASYVKKPIFERKPFAFANNQLLNNEIDYEEEDSSLRKQSL